MDEATNLIGQMVVVRSSPSGVWLGRLVAREGTMVTLTAARRAWSWEGAASCSGLAARGPRGGRIAEPVAVAIIADACEVLAATPVAVIAWEKIQPWVA